MVKRWLVVSFIDGLLKGEKAKEEAPKKNYLLKWQYGLLIFWGLPMLSALLFRGFSFRMDSITGAARYYWELRFFAFTFYDLVAPIYGFVEVLSRFAAIYGHFFLFPFFGRITDRLPHSGRGR